jgi:hypothetical protein
MSKAGFKVIELDRYCDFERFTASYPNINTQASMEKKFEFIQRLHEQGKENPLTYIEECNDLGFPPRKGIKYCIAAKNGKVKNRYYKPYHCFCYQMGKWWQYKEIQYIFTDLYVPQIMSHYDFYNYKSSLRFLSNDAHFDWQFHRHAHELRAVARNVELSFISFFLKNKLKKRKVKKQKSKLP